SVMDLTRLAVDAGQLINRAVQYTGESLGQADKTELDPGLEGLLAQADATKTWTDSIISQTEVLLQPSLGARLEDRLYEHLEWSAPPRPRAHELLGDQMTQTGLEIGSNTPYGTALIRCGEAQKQLGEAERKFAESTNIHFLTPLKSFTEGEYRAIQNERKMLVNKRLDLDVAKTRLRKAHEADREARIWAQEISQMELRICQSLFDHQSEITRRALEGISNTHINHMRSLADFVDGQASFFAQGNQHAQELQRQMSRSAFIIHDLNDNCCILITTMKTVQLLTQPVGLDQVAPVPKASRQLPDFDQDSWTLAVNPKTETDLFSSDHANNNNNNNSAFGTPGQSSGHQAAVKNQLFTDQTFDLVFTSNQPDELPSPSRTNQGTSSLPSAARDSTRASNATFTNGAATAVASPPPQGSAIHNETQTGDAEAADITASTDVVPDSQTANETHERPVNNGEDV
uniref:BAR domain-containing protein n=1 Tax=Poecilia mexicana TaxID=48701 RepID=A0A3B3X3J6_9TELE